MNDGIAFPAGPAATLRDAAGDVAPMISVIIPHYNDMENLRICLRLLSGQTQARSTYEIIVADNNSACGFEAVEKLCDIQAIAVPAPIQGAAEARNAGVRASRGAILAFIDSDCRPKAQWLENGVKALADADIIGGQVDVDFEKAESPTGVEAFEKVFAFDFKKYIEKDNFSGTGNMFVTRRAFNDIGDFESGVSEDREWGNRAVSKGFSISYAPSAIVSHPARKTWLELTGKWQRIAEQSYLYNIHRNKSDIVWIFYCIEVLVSPLLVFTKIVFSKKLSGARLKSLAIVVLFRIRLFRFIYGLKLLHTINASPRAGT